MSEHVYNGHACTLGTIKSACFTEMTLLYRGDFITVNKRAVIDILLS